MIAIIGAGQLGRMLALAAYPLGEHIRVLDPSAESPAGHCAPLIIGAYNDAQALKQLTDNCRVVTYEFENVSVDAADHLVKSLPVYPPPAALRASQDRVDEKTFLNKLGIATAAWAAVSTRAEFDAALQKIGVPGVLKTRRMGYDGKGQAVIKDRVTAERAWQQLGSQPLIYEGFVYYQREVSCLSVRNVSGDMVFYPLAENWHHDGILRTSIAPAPQLSPELQQQAERNAQKIMRELHYVGVLAVEYFQVGEQLIANEMAPRVHNSGHWSIEGAACSQFENHIRAITNRPLGSTAIHGATAMLNIIGEFPDLTALLKIPGVHLHHYGKATRAGRKIGHITVVAADHDALKLKIAEVRAVTGLHKESAWSM
jgi:5-(carboxyamino)imidazole ribonucleotide synthase